MDAGGGGRVQTDGGGRMDTAAGGRKRHQKEAKKPRKSADGMVVAMEKYLEMKTKQVEEERAESRKVEDFSITRCIGVLKTMEGVTRDDKIKAFEVFKIAENREIFINAASDDEVTALMWLHSQIEK